MSAFELSQTLGERLRERALTIATGESVTGGALSAALTAIAGSSDYFQGGVVAYSPEAKQSLLHVPRAILDTAGPVSEECTVAMAQGARRALRADLALATTGIAGPTGAEPDKPVGLVFIAFAAGENVTCDRFVFPGDRLGVIADATREALALAVARLRGEV